MNINGISNNITTEYQATKTYTEKNTTKNTENVKETAEKTAAENVAEQGAVYEKGETPVKGLYSINKMSKADREAMVDQLKSDMESRKQQLINIVRETITGQVSTFGNATDDDIWKKLASGNFTVDAQTKAQAQKDIAEDGYWGVKQTSQRLFDFASALAGDDEKKMQEMQKAMHKGVKEATKAWGRDLPDITKNTLDAADKLFEDYYKSKSVGNVE
ncbi:MAG: hypothetical protein IJM91_04165 [Lachnospiraceae bacterium]|nr:hypothetical protein [Lachnospiraceae bacterium]